MQKFQISFPLTRYLLVIQLLACFMVLSFNRLNVDGDVDHVNNSNNDMP